LNEKKVQVNLRRSVPLSILSHDCIITLLVVCSISMASTSSAFSAISCSEI